MHYKNGREAKVGDIILTRGSNNIPVTGVVVKAIAEISTCNLIVVPVSPNLQQWVTAKEALHIDDVMPTEAPPAA